MRLRLAATAIRACGADANTREDGADDGVMRATSSLACACSGRARCGFWSRWWCRRITPQSRAWARPARTCTYIMHVQKEKCTNPRNKTVEMDLADDANPYLSLCTHLWCCLPPSSFLDLVEIAPFLVATRQLSRAGLGPGRRHSSWAGAGTEKHQRTSGESTHTRMSTIRVRCVCVVPTPRTDDSRTGRDR